jgi:hypothetical protein
MTAEACVPSKVLGLHLDVLGLQHELCVLYQDVLGLQHELCVLFHLQWEGVYRERNTEKETKSTCFNPCVLSYVVPSYYLRYPRPEVKVKVPGVYTHPSIQEVRVGGPFGTTTQNFFGRLPHRPTSHTIPSWHYRVPGYSSPVSLSPM